ncbi:hypothetical protein JT358_07430 [Micrococcales bacterium 31B]|nr:hypothetical protein [Micrococcales bacterium 31B]
MSPSPQSAQPMLPSTDDLVTRKRLSRRWLPVVVTGFVSLALVGIWAGPAEQFFNGLQSGPSSAVSNALLLSNPSAVPTVVDPSMVEVEPPSQRATSGVQNSTAAAGSTISVAPVFAKLPPSAVFRSGTLAIAPPATPSAGYTYLTNSDGSITALREARVIAVFSVENDTVKIEAAGGTTGSVAQIGISMLDTENGLSTGDIVLTVL